MFRPRFISHIHIQTMECIRIDIFSVSASLLQHSTYYICIILRWTLLMELHIPLYLNVTMTYFAEKLFVYVKRVEKPYGFIWRWKLLPFHVGSYMQYIVEDLKEKIEYCVFYNFKLMLIMLNILQFIVLIVFRLSVHNKMCLCNK